MAFLGLCGSRPLFDDRPIVDHDAFALRFARVDRRYFSQLADVGWRVGVKHGGVNDVAFPVRAGDFAPSKRQVVRRRYGLTARALAALAGMGWRTMLGTAITCLIVSWPFGPVSMMASSRAGFD